MTYTIPNRRTTPQIISRGYSTKKFRTFLALLLCVVFAGSAFSQNARGLSRTKAADPLDYKDGDLFLGFRSTDGTNDYLVNIGQPDQFVKAAPGSTFEVAMGNTNADLAAIFGADWYTRIDPRTGRNAVLWSVVGGRQIAAAGDPDNTLYSTNPLLKPWPRRSDTAQAFTTSLIAALGNTLSGNQPSTNNPQGLAQRAESINSYAAFQPRSANSGGVSFQTWNPWNEARPFESLFFNRITPGPGAGTVLGAFTLSGSGQLSFNAASKSADAMPSISTRK